MNKVPKKRRHILISSLLINFTLILLSITCIYPVIWLVFSSLKTDSDFLSNTFGLPEKYVWSNYYEALIKTNMFKYFFNTLFNSVTAVIVIAFFTFCIGYFLSRYRFKGKGFVESLLLLGMVVPTHALLVPMYIQFDLLDIVNRRGVLVLPYLGVQLPVCVFIIRAFMSLLPTELEESAEIEGANIYITLTRIIVPVAKPVIVTVMVISFYFAWNEMPFSLVLNSSENLRNMACAIRAFASETTVQWTLRITACVLSLVPVMIIYGVFNKHIVEGTVAGALKG